MPNNTLKIIRNSKRRECTNCGFTHDYISRVSEHAPCSTPVAYRAEAAKRISRALAGGAKDVVNIPTDTRVIIDDNSRRLPKMEEPELRRFVTRERLA
jgi:hypothetical protein